MGSLVERLLSRSQSRPGLFKVPSLESGLFRPAAHAARRSMSTKAAKMRRICGPL